MRLGRVIGSLWATQKDASVDGLRLVLVQPVRADGTPAGRPFASLDTVGAGPGETVLVATSTEAGLPFGRPLVATDATVVGIVDPTPGRPGAGSDRP